MSNPVGGHTGARGCPSCFKPLVLEPVQVLRGDRYSSDREWIDSTVRRCANTECHAVVEGSLEDRLAHIRTVYGYKYFGDYELSPEQLDAVLDAQRLARLVPSLADALKLAEQFIVNGVELGFIRLPTIPDPALNTLPAIRSALSRARGEG